MNKEKFIVSVYDAAYKRLKELGKDDVAADFYARMFVSQGCLESDFGNAESGTYNYFGLKATPQQDGTLVTTHEFSGKNRMQIKDKFLNFRSFDDGIRFAVDRLNAKFKAFDGELTPESYVDSIKRYGYFTEDRNVYLKRIKGVLRGSFVPKVLEEHKLSAKEKRKWISTPSFLQQQGINTNDATKVERPLILSDYMKKTFVPQTPLARLREMFERNRK